MYSDSSSRLRRLWSSRVVRYLFFGGLTVLVNLLSFYLLTKWANWGSDVSNAVSILLALLFAYGTNTRFVFRSKCGSFHERLMEFLRFVTARLFTMALEFLGVHYLIRIFPEGAMAAKIGVQAVVVILNYLFSRLVIYRDGKR